MREYHLILPANPDKGHSAGESAGSVLAHWFHLKKLKDRGVKEGVMWFWHFQDTGIAERMRFRPRLTERKEIKLPLATVINGQEIKISDIGFIYEGNHRFTHAPSSIAWQFRADKIIIPEKVNESLEEYEAFVPYFRRVYLNWDDYSDERWLLIRELKQLEKPIEMGANGILKGFERHIVSDRKFGNLKVNVLRKNVFAMYRGKYPKLKDPDPIKELDRQLKRLLTSPEKKLVERKVHEAFLMKKIFLEGCKLYDEGALGEEGVFDTLFQDKSGKYVAVEFKLEDEGSSAEQLKRYIRGIEENRRKWGIEEGAKIEGEIVCGNPQREELDGFKVIEWRLSIQF